MISFLRCSKLSSSTTSAMLSQAKHITRNERSVKLLYLIKLSINCLTHYDREFGTILFSASLLSDRGRSECIYVPRFQLSL